VLVQERLIARVRQLCLADERLAAALTYGSFAHGAGDAYSDIEFWLFFAGPIPDPGAWLARIGSVRHVVVNEFGAHVVFFDGLVRGEFHLSTAADIGSVATWPARGGPVADMVAALHAATATADPASLSAALAAAWRHGRSCWTRLAVPVPGALFAELDDTFGG
jgi:hypothetical protein